MNITYIQHAITLLIKIINEELSTDNNSIFEKLKKNLAKESPIPLKNKIITLQYSTTICEPFYCAEYDRLENGLYGISPDVKKLLQYYKEKLFELTPPKTKEDLYKQKLLKAKNNSIEFIDKLGEMVVGDAPYFPYRSSYNITNFFKDAGYPELKHDGTTRRKWASLQLENLPIDGLYNIIKSLFNKKYFQNINVDEEINIEKAKETLKDLINDSIKPNEYENLHDIFDIDINSSLLFQTEIETIDEELNSDIDDARQYFMEGKYKEALKFIWDAFERIKSLYNNNKKDSIQIIVSNLSDEIKLAKGSTTSLDINQEHFFFNNEIKVLTDLGNNYKIRHSEKQQIPIHNCYTQQYLFFRVLNLINLIYKRMEINL